MNLLFLSFLAPLLGFLTLAFARGRISENAAAVIGVVPLALVVTSPAQAASSYSCGGYKATIVGTPPGAAR